MSPYRPEKLEARMRWALALLRSPRVRESDAAALLLRLLFRKYALDLGWDVTLTPAPKVETDGWCSPRLRMPFNLRSEGYNAVDDVESTIHQPLAHGHAAAAGRAAALARPDRRQTPRFHV
jgi:hypothetical protein